jgi:probable F420-dependent oxidoreductase
MKIGVAYPATEIAGDPDALRRFVKAAEELGFAYIMTPDHVLSATHKDRHPKLNGPYTEKETFPDPFVLFSFAAALSDKLEFVTGVLILPQRQTAVVAQQAADLDLLSKERLRLGVGIGWNYVEYEALGQDFKSRSARIDEQVVLLREYWTKQLVKFEGRFDRVDRAGINPRPRRSIPIWYGGHSELGFERGARIGDGFIYAARAKGAIEGLGRVKHYLKVHGRSEVGYGSDLLAIFAKDVTESADDLNSWRDAGGTHGCVHTTDKGLAPNIDAHIDFIAQVKKRVK